MKYLIVLLLILYKSIEEPYAQGRAFSQKITVEFSNALLEDVLREITLRSGIHFAYNSDIINPDKRITIRLKEVTPEQIVRKVAEHFNLEYTIVRRQFILRKANIDVEGDYQAPQIPKTRQVPKYTISGLIKDAETGQSLPGTTIWIQEITTGTISNQFGFFSLTLPEGKYNVEFSFMGFRKESVEIELDRDINHNIDLELNTEILGEVTITVNEKLEQIEKSQMSHITVNPTNMRNMPEFAGEIGLIRGLGSLPGIKVHSDASAFFFVRGGNKDQNMILIDGAPVYNPAHLFGYFSAIVPETAKNITVYKGDIPIEMGGRLSSVIDVETRKGNMKRFGMDGVLNPFVSRLALEGPIVRDRVSVYTSFRRSNFGWIYRESNPNVSLYFQGFNFKANWIANENNRIYYSTFNGRDNYTNTEGSTGIRWNNNTSTLRWAHIFSNRLFANTTIYASSYNYSLLLGNDNRWESGITDFTMRYDLTFYANPNNTYKFGFLHSRYTFNPGNLSWIQDNRFLPKLIMGGASKTQLYFGREFQLNERWSFEAGLRLPLWNHKGPARVFSFDDTYRVTDTILYQENESIKRFLNISPAFSARYRLSQHASVKFSYNINHQFLHLLSNSISPLSSFEIWVPSGAHIRPQRAHQTAVGLNFYIPRLKLQIIPEAYYKKMFNQLDFVPHANLMLNPTFHNQIRFGKARSHGMEFLVRRTEGRLTGWISYSWSRVFKQFDELNNGQKFPAFYDRPHDISVFLNYHIGRRVSISANWTYHTGSAITTPVGFFEFNGSTVPLYGTTNNDRLPDYHRLDLSFTVTLNRPTANFDHSINFGIYNFYNRHNPVSINFNKIETRNGNIVVPANLYGTHEILTTKKYMLGIMPTISYRFRL